MNLQCFKINSFFSLNAHANYASIYEEEKGRGRNPGDTVMSLYRALTMDTYSLLQIDIRVGPDKKKHLNRSN